MQQKVLQAVGSNSIPQLSTAHPKRFQNAHVHTGSLVIFEMTFLFHGKRLTPFARASGDVVDSIFVPDDGDQIHRKAHSTHVLYIVTADRALRKWWWIIADLNVSSKASMT